MRAQRMLPLDLPVLAWTDPVSRALTVMDEFKLMHLPVVEEDVYKGTVSEATLLEMGGAGVQPSPRTFNTLLKGYGQSGQLRRAFDVVRRMREQLGAAAPNQVTYNTLIHACVLFGDLPRARQLLSWLAKGAGAEGGPARPPPSVQSYTALMRGYLSHLSCANGTAPAVKWRAAMARKRASVSSPSSQLARCVRIAGTPRRPSPLVGPR